MQDVVAVPCSPSAPLASLLPLPCANHSPGRRASSFAPRGRRAPRSTPSRARGGNPGGSLPHAPTPTALGEDQGTGQAARAPRFVALSLIRTRRWDKKAGSGAMQCNAARAVARGLPYTASFYLLPRESKPELHLEMRYAPWRNALPDVARKAHGDLRCLVTRQASGKRLGRVGELGRGLQARLSICLTASLSGDRCQSRCDAVRWPGVASLPRTCTYMLRWRWASSRTGIEVGGSGVCLPERSAQWARNGDQEAQDGKTRG
ncbi:hypothetical protein BD309DRAFT_617813 [Dichomitus squalens]|uniref:Uncharacterized protein n=1 Tax=Dichomitus squalens TaxID=114155 RepID=A0A4Q9P028_9APHY|nr:hypothetical protein BD309DRAFT_617813 [Dichomitus squalens]TBU65292.1 hypothetical protein BD310DRAFT_1421 [Dichomitus squalens]